jgi:hypothetical protein
MLARIRRAAPAAPLPTAFPAGRLLNPGGTDVMGVNGRTVSNRTALGPEAREYATTLTP